MNPLTNIKNVQKLNERELELGIIGKKSWHDEYKDSAWIFLGGLPFDLTEGDIICVFSQYGEIVNINLVRDHKTGKSKGFAFLCYEDQRSTVLSVDNLNAIKILGRTIRVDHVKDYKVPKEHGDEDDITKQIRADGCAPKVDSLSASGEEEKSKEDKKAKKTKKKKRKNSPPSRQEVKIEVKKERYDPVFELAHNGMHERSDRLGRAYPGRSVVGHCEEGLHINRSESSSRKKDRECEMDRRKKREDSRERQQRRRRD